MIFSNFFNPIGLKFIISQKSNDTIDSMKKMLKWFPNNRMNVNNLLNHLFIIIILWVKLFLILITLIVKFTLVLLIIIIMEIKDFSIELILIILIIMLLIQ